MRVWLVCFVALFSLAELYQWVSASQWLEQIALLPLPVLAAAGFGLAIASNAKKHLPWQAWPQHSPDPIEPTTTPSIEPPQPSSRSISFTIHKEP